MVDILKVDRVQYVWNEETGERAPLCYLYFCKYCLDIRSADNLQHEVDSHYCSQSLDGVPTTEAILKKNKSANCWECPSCPHTLSTRATTVYSQVPGDPSKEASKKTYYLACSFCRWTSRDGGLEDQASASGGWSEKEIPNLLRINNVIDYYKYIAQKEKNENKNAKKRGYMSLAMQLQQRYGAKKQTGRKMHPASPLNAVARMKDQQELKEVSIAPAATLSNAEVEPLPEEYYTQDIDFSKITSIWQRLNLPEHQPTEVGQYHPKRSTMFNKRSLRCKQCEHNLIKPEYHPSSIKFKMQLVAIHYIPEVRIYEEVVLRPGVPTRVTLVAINRTDHASTITFLPLVPENVNYTIGNSQCQPPHSSMIVSQFHDADAEFDSAHEIGKVQDDPEIVAFRKGNKLGFYVWCTPNPELKEGEDVWISFSMKYDHQSNMAMLLQQKVENTLAEPEVSWLCHKIFVNLGKLSSAE